MLQQDLNQRTRAVVALLVSYGLQGKALTEILVSAPRVLAQTLPQLTTRISFAASHMGASLQVRPAPQSREHALQVCAGPCRPGSGVQDIAAEPRLLFMPVPTVLGLRHHVCCTVQGRPVLLPSQPDYAAASKLSAAAMAAGTPEGQPKPSALPAKVGPGW